MLEFIKNLLYQPLYYNNKIPRTLSQINDDTNKGSFVYHVANPEVKGVVKEIVSETHCLVHFELSVSFSGNPHAGKRKEWICSRNLLYPTPELAKFYHNLNL